MSALPDAATRLRATTDFETNLVVQAGAGTGKTSLLVERLLNAVGTGVARLDQVAAITFTEKAAGEMRQRLAAGLDRLRRLARGEVEAGGTEADRAFAWIVGPAGVSRADLAARALAAMELVDRAKVTTIHAFCAELLRAHPIDAGVDPSFAVDDGAHAAALCETLWEEFLGRELGPQATRAELWHELLACIPLDEAERVAHGLADFHVPQELLRPPFRELDAGQVFRPRALAVCAEIDDLMQRQRGMSPLPTAFFAAVREALAALAAGGLEAFRQVVTQQDRLREALEPGGGAPSMNARLSGVPHEEAKALARRARDLAKELHRLEEHPARLALEAAAPFGLEFREALLARGFVSFQGLLALARDLLRDSPEVRRALKRRYRLLLVDEFQDTDPLQYEIVLFLAEREDTAAASAWEAELAPGRLFVVGDAKQSVYRFRGADYSAYRRAVDRVVETGGLALDLIGNFRSRPGLVAPVNDLFGARSTCWKAGTRQPEYVPIEAVRGPAPEDEPAIELWTIDDDPTTAAEARREAEGRLIAAEIERRVAGGARYEQFTLLLRAFTNIALYLRPLRERGIPFIVDGGREFLRRPEVAQLMATLRVVGQPADPTALLAFLRSPAGAASDVELAEYARAGGRFNLWRSEVDAARFPAVAASFAVLRELVRETAHLPADAVVRRVVERTLQLPLGAAAYEGSQRVANLRKLASAAGELGRDGKLSLDQVVEALREGRLQDIETDRPISDDQARAVRITSIHRMKGLENDFVFLADLSREPYHPIPEARVAVARVEPGGAALALRLGERGNERGNVARVAFQAEHREHEIAEEVRVLYVALTRARERLVVIVGLPREMEARPERIPWIQALAPWGYDRAAAPADGARIDDGRVLHRRLQPLERAQPSVRPSIPGAERAVATYAAALEAARTAARPPLAAPSGLREEQDRLRAAGIDAARGLVRDLGKGVGIAIHRWLEAWKPDDPEADGRLDAVCRATAAELDLDPRELAAEAQAIREAFSRSDLGSYFGSIEILGREVPVLLARGDGGAYRGSIDLVYRDPNGQVAVADYKTDRDADDAALVERYGEQLGIYADALRRGLELDSAPRAELWLLRSGRRIELLSQR